METPLSAMGMGNGAAAKIAPAVVSGGKKKRRKSMGHGVTMESMPRRGITQANVLNGRQPSVPMALSST